MLVDTLPLLHQRFLLVSISLFTLAATSLEGQTAPARTPTEPEREVVELSPFVVNTDQDEGWIASNTMLASRTNQPLKEVPVTIETMTQELMLDLGVFDAFGAAEWVANSQVTPESERIEYTGGESPDTNRYSYRGIPNESGPTKNLFNWMTPSDSYNIERIDFGRGSNSLLFGDTEPGGQANIYTKRARPGRSFGSVLVGYGSFNTSRVNFDYNHSFSDKLAVRVNLMHSYKENYYDWYEAGEHAGHFTVTYRPFKNTSLRAEGEIGRYKRNLVTNSLRRFQNQAPGLGFNQRYTVLPGGDVVDNRTLPALDRKAGGGAVLGFLDKDSGIPKEMSWEAVRSLDQDFYNYSVYLDQRIGELGLEVAGIRQFHERMQDQSRHNNRVRFDSEGRPYLDHSWQYTQSEFYQDSVRVTAAYDWKATDWMSQLFVANANWTEWKRKNFSEQERNFADPNPAAAQARPWYRVYLDDPSQYRRELLTRYDVPKSPTVDIRPFVTQTIEQLFPQRDFSLSMSGRYFNGKLFSMLGVRLDRGYRLTSQGWMQANKTPDGQAVTVGSYQDHPERYVLDPAIPGLNEWTKSYGLVYAVNSRINVYSTISESFRQANGAAVDFTGDPIGQQRGETFEIGMKSDFFNRKMSWNLDYYDLERRNVEFQVNLQGMTSEELEDVINPNNLTLADPGYIQVDGRREKRKQFSRGVESTFIFYPGEGWNIRVSAAMQKVTQGDSMPKLKPLVAAAQARGDEDPELMANALDIIKLSGLDGQKIAGRAGTPFSFTYAVKYDFRQKGPLHGLSLGLNGRYNDDYIFNYIIPEGVKGGKLFTLNGFAGYQTKVWGRPVTFRLNVSNLLKTEYYTNSAANVSGTPVNVSSYGPPRTWLVTMMTKF